MPVSSSHTKVLSLTYVALMAALMAVCAWITIPVGPVPFTMQTFAVFAALGLLGGKRGHLGGGGLPPAGAGGAAGVCRVFQRSGCPAGAHGRVPGGLSGLCPGVLGGDGQWGKSLPGMALAMGLGLVVCYAFGTVWFLLVYTGGGSAATLLGALTLCVFPYILPDLGKIVLALVLTRRVGKYVRG